MSRPERISFFESYYEAVKDLKPADRLALYDAILGYAFDGIEPVLKGGVQKTAFTLVKPNIDSDIKYREKGAKGGRPKKPKGGLSENKKGGFEKTKTEMEVDMDMEMEVDKELEKEKEKRKRFKPPTIEEVDEYANQIGRRIDSQRFIDYYTANGWKVGKNPMKDWKAAVRNWTRNSQDQNSGNPFYDMLQTGDY